MKVWIEKPVSELPPENGNYFVIMSNRLLDIVHYSTEYSWSCAPGYFTHYLVQSESPSPVEVEAAAKEYVTEKFGPGCYGRMVDRLKDAYKAGYNFRANHLGEDREGQDEFDKRLEYSANNISKLHSPILSEQVAYREGVICGVKSIAAREYWQSQKGDKYLAVSPNGTQLIEGWYKDADGNNFQLIKKQQ